MNERAKRSSAEYQYVKSAGGLTLWHTRKISAIRSVHRLCRADKNEKRKQNTVYISDKHRQVEYRLLCVYQKKVRAQRRMDRFWTGECIRSYEKYRVFRII